MRTSDEGIQKIILREGKRLNAYPDPHTGGEPWTIGVGHTGTVDGIKVHRGMSISNDKCTELLKNDLKRFEDALNKVLRVDLAPNQYDAIISLLFNVGAGYAKADMSIIAAANRSDFISAARGFDLFHKPAIIIGRRNGEKLQFQTPYTNVRAIPPAPQEEAPKVVEQKKGNIMLITQQWQGVLRQILPFASGIGVMAGYFTQQQASTGSELIINLVSAVAGLGSLVWSIHSNSASTIKNTANKL